MSRVLVVGSYPPVPRPASAATVAAVRRAWADGHEVEVVSPRPSAAHRSARVAGMRASSELARLRRLSRADDLVLCVEAGLPLDRASGSVPRWCQAALLALVFRGFRSVTLVVADDPTENAAALAALWPHAHHLVVATEEHRQVLIGLIGVRPGLIQVDARGGEPPRRYRLSDGASLNDEPPQVAVRERGDRLRDAYEPQPSVTLFGPPEWLWHERPRRFVSMVARRLLGRRVDTIRAPLVRVYRWVRPTAL